MTTPNLPPQRTDTHRTDTLAVRKLFTQLSPNWLIRDLSERDYGIDLMLEYYDGHNPTGQIIFFQVKGKSTLRRNEEVIKCQLGKKTLLYAEYFPEPFVLVHTSPAADEPIYFVWIQKYISHTLDRDVPLWRTATENSIDIAIPLVNTFKDNEDKLIEISKKNVFQKLSMKFLSIYMFWEYEFNDLQSGNFDHAPLCVNRLNMFKQLSSLFEKYTQGEIPDYANLRNCLESYDQLSDTDYASLAEFNELLQLIKTSILTENDQEEFAAEMTGELPY